MSINGDVGDELTAEIENRSGDVSRRLRKTSDVIFFAAAAGKAAGLVDVKIVRVSERLSGEKFVIPVTKR